jgi:hypothetical protein
LGDRCLSWLACDESWIVKRTKSNSKLVLVIICSNSKHACYAMLCLGPISPWSTASTLLSSQLSALLYFSSISDLRLLTC